MDYSCGFVHESIADIAEEQLVEQLLSEPLWGYEFFHLAGMPEIRMKNRQRVPLNTALGGIFKGDVDVLLCDPDRPDQAVAYQVKRIKCGISQLRRGAPSKLREYNKLAQQANLLAQMGFWQVYAYAVVVVDTREQNSGKLTYACLSSKLKGLVDSAISPDVLNERVGLALLDFTQPMDHKPFTVGTHGFTLRRLSIPAPQNQDLTKWVAEVFSRPQQA